MVSQIGAGLAAGDVADSGTWREVLAVDEGRGRPERALFTRWDDEAIYTYTESVHSEGSAIRVIEADANYDRVGESQFMWVTFAFIGFGILAFNSGYGRIDLPGPLFAVASHGDRRIGRRDRCC